MKARSQTGKQLTLWHSGQTYYEFLNTCKLFSTLVHEQLLEMHIYRHSAEVLASKVLYYILYYIYRLVFSQNYSIFNNYSTTSNLFSLI